MGGLFWVLLGVLAGLAGWRLAQPLLAQRSARKPVVCATLPLDSKLRGLPYSSLPGVSFAGLTDRQVFEVMHRASAEPCTCGCKENLAECRNTDAECKTSLGLARALVNEARERVYPAPGR